jgi:hypothetical protein
MLTKWKDISENVRSGDIACDVACRSKGRIRVDPSIWPAVPAAGSPGFRRYFSATDLPQHWTDTEISAS